MNHSKSALNTPMSDGLNLKQAIEQQIASVESNDSSNESGSGSNNQNFLISHCAW